VCIRELQFSNTRETLERGTPVHVSNFLVPEEEGIFQILSFDTEIFCGLHVRLHFSWTANQQLVRKV
jgi:hypothetical protein